MGALLRDLAQTLRTLLRSPGFTAVVVLTLALGIGANSAIFSVVDGVLLRPLPYEDPDELVRLFHQNPETGVERGSFSPPDFEDLERAVEGAAFQSLAAFWFVPGLSGANLSGGDVAAAAGDPRPLRLDVAYVSGDFFPTLGVPAALGRTLRPDEDAPGRDAVVVLSDGLWRRRWGRDRSVLGKTVQLEGGSFTVVGVMPPDFRLPSREADAWVPLSQIGEDDIPTHRSLRWMSALGRLAPGVAAPEAEAAVSAVLARLAEEYPDTNRQWVRAGLTGLRESLVGDLRTPLLTLLAAVGAVLLIACANLANLLLARTSARRRELAVRAALGATRRHLVRQMLAEASLLTLAGAGLGLLVAWSSLPLLLNAAGDAVPRPEAIRIDTRVLLFTLLLAAVTALLFGLLPALRAATVERSGALQGGSGTATAAEGARMRGLLVVAETALAVALLIGAGLLVRSLWELARTDPGFRTEDVLTLSFSVSDGRFDGRGERQAYQERILERIAAVPGALAVGGAKTVPLRGGGEPVRFGVPGRPEDELVEPEAGMYIVTPGYFRALGIPLLAGRMFRDIGPEDDRPPEIVVNRSFARQVWGREDVVGEVLLGGEETGIRVAGVVEDVRSQDLATPPGSAVYLPTRMAPRSTMKVFVRTAGEPMALADAVRHAVHEVDADQPISEVTTLAAVRAEQTARPRLLTGLVGLFAVLALLLAAVGLYGVVSFTVGRQRREIGIRMALGAGRGRVVAGVIGRSALLTGAGLALGLFLAWAGSRLLASQLYAVDPTDPAAFAGAAAVLAAVSLAAAALPAARAAGTDPVEALRSE